MNVAFLLGSGSSSAAGLPTTAKLTESILAGEGYARHSDGSYFKGQPLYALIDEPDSHVPHISNFLRWLTCYVSRYYDRNFSRAVNYEDLYYLVEQIYSEELGNLDNPFVIEAERDIRLKLCECAEQISRKTHASLAITIVSEDMLNYMASIVAAELAAPHSPPDYLDFLVDALHVNPSNQLSIFTLNHDLLLEEFLRSRSVGVVDGFGAATNSVRYWNPALLSETSPGCLVLKLHGSIRWFRFRSDGGDWYDERIGLPETGDIQHTKDPDGKSQRPIDSLPIILIGTFNKILQYSGGIFLDFFAEFRRRLAKAETLVVCGYGFGDKGINGQIVEWVYGQRNRHIIMVHPNPDKLRDGARGAVQNKWDAWLENGTLQICISRIQEITWPKIAVKIAGL